MAQKTTKLLTRRRKFIEVDIPVIKSKMELIGNSPEDLEGKTIKLDLTRQLKGKGVEATVKIRLENGKAVAYPSKIKLMSYFIRRMIRKNISYVEDSFETPSQESMLNIKPFLITRKRVSRAVRKTLRNKARNWIEDYIASKKNNEIFSEVLTNRMQKPLSLMLKKTYPLSLCEIRVLEIKRTLEKSEIPKVKLEKKEEKEEEKKPAIEEGLDQLQEIEEERIKQAEKEIKETQKKAIEKEEEQETEEKEETKEKTEKKAKSKTTRKKESKPEEE
jgi:ribosomal protein S3AE